ncbi:hypothetical protein PRIPAC_80018 [Pristionchus pacificus]|uniref:Uncharacterized protein n=1 Tax=Pristionchus pacificus TaxID=54126 RepID=A0A2A6CP22_PRIPA|nr:hypothetical protein PRIPAC_80018 [Pristionchus pacificus]|eukprot:PDM79848.1 hypothetical protein PRIPAC_32427 [Pristionchus pacificus]
MAIYERSCVFFVCIFFFFVALTTLCSSFSDHVLSSQINDILSTDLHPIYPSSSAHPLRSSRMAEILGNLGTHLFQSVTDKAGNIGNRFEEDFSSLSHNITGLARNITDDVNKVTGEVVVLSVFIKIALVLLSILLFLLILRYLTFGGRALFCQVQIIQNLGLDYIEKNTQKFQHWCLQTEYWNPRTMDQNGKNFGHHKETTKC